MKMKTKHLYLVTAIVSLVFALALLLMPTVMLSLFGVTYTKGAAAMGQLVAVELTVSGVILLMVRDVVDLKVRTALNIGNMVAGVLGVFIALNSTLNGAFGWFGYVIAAIYALMVVAFGYFQFFGPVN
jgi:hypothetical protein